MAELIGIHYSPWTIKARWALDLKKNSFQYQEYTPLLSEPSLRLKIRRFRGRISVPVYLDGSLILADSFEIASYADKKGSGPSLVPSSKRCHIHEWNLIGHRIAAAGRALVLHKAKKNKNVLLEALPAPLQKSQKIGFIIGKIGLRYVTHKYGKKYLEAAQKILAQDLKEVTTHLKLTQNQPRKYLLDEFSLADIAIASALQFVDPVGNDFIQLGKHARLTFQQPNLIALFADLLQWRDQIFSSHFVLR